MLQRGQGMTEYIIIVALIAIMAIGAVGYFGDTVRQQTAGMAKELAGDDASTEIQGAKTAATAAATEAGKHGTMGSYNDNGN